MPKKTLKPEQQLIPVEAIERRIFLIRGQKVMLDRDLAELYGVPTRRLNEQLRRNLDRFPEDFAFILTQQELKDLKSHFATSRSGWGGRRKLPYAFTEHGVVMAAPTAVRASIQVVRAFVRLREILATRKDLAQKLDQLEKKVARHDQQIKAVFDAIRQLLDPAPVPSRRQIGFSPKEENKG
jgi:hypothetical protein